MLQGGYQFDGITEISSLDEEEVTKCVDNLWEQGIRNFVVSGIFSALNCTHEKKVILLLDSHMTLT